MENQDTIPAGLQNLAFNQDEELPS